MSTGSRRRAKASVATAAGIGICRSEDALYRAENASCSETASGLFRSARLGDPGGDGDVDGATAGAGSTRSENVGSQVGSRIRISSA